MVYAAVSKTAPVRVEGSNPSRRTNLLGNGKRYVEGMSEVNGLVYLPLS